MLFSLIKKLIKKKFCEKVYVSNHTTKTNQTFENLQLSIQNLVNFNI